MFNAQRFCKKFLPSGYTGFLGLEYVENGVDDIVLKMPVSPGVCENGLVSKSALTGAVDMAAMLSVWVSIDEIRPHATLNLRVEHMGKIALDKGNIRLCAMHSVGQRWCEGRREGFYC